MPRLLTLTFGVLNVAYVIIHLTNPDVVDGLSALQRLALTAFGISAFAWIVQARSGTIDFLVGYQAGRADALKGKSPRA